MAVGVGRRSRSLTDFAVKANQFSTVGLPGASRKSVEAAALFATNAARTSIRGGSGGDSALSNVGRRGGARVGARYDMKGTTNPTALIYATGPLHLLDNPTRAHLITARGYRLSRAKSKRDQVYNAIFGGEFSGSIGSARRATPMRTPYGPRYYARHPGTRGKRTFFRGINAAEPFLPRIFQSEMKQQMRRYWS